MWKKWIIILAVVAGVIFFVPYSLPLIFAFLTAILLEGLVNYYQRKLNLSRVKSVLASFITYLLGITVIGYNLFLLLFQQALRLSEKTPTYVKDLYSTAIKPLIRKWESYSKTLPPDAIDSVENSINNAINSLDSFLQATVQFLIHFLTGIPGFLIELLVYMIALFLFSLELPNIKEKVKAHLTPQTKEKLSIVIKQLTLAGLGLIKTHIFLSLLTFILALIGLAILGVKYTALIALLIVIVDILPILGTGSVLVPWAIISLLQAQKFLGFGLIILFLVITIVRRIIEPKMYATNLGISPLSALISFYIGFKLLGFIGLFAGPAIVILIEALIKVNIIRFNFKL